MAIRPILRYPDSRLREKSVDVVAFDDGLRQLINDMSETMFASNGAGLAAIQVGTPLRVFIIDGPVAVGADDAPPKVFINPEIVSLSDESQTGDEGCLSFPGIYVPVKRGLRARVRARDLDGNTFEVEGEALFARDLERAYQSVDVLVSPATPTTAFRLGEKVDDPVFTGLDECTQTIVGEVESLKGLVDEFSQFARMPSPRTPRPSSVGMPIAPVKFPSEPPPELCELIA